MIIEAALLATTAVGAVLALAFWFDEAVRSLLLPSVVQSAGLNLRIIGAAAFAGLISLIVVLGSAAILMLVVAMLATFVPVRSASRTDPSSLPRTE